MIAFMHVATNEDNEDAQKQSNPDYLILLLDYLAMLILNHYLLGTSIYGETNIFLHKMYCKMVLPEFNILKNKYILILFFDERASDKISKNKVTLYHVLLRIKLKITHRMCFILLS